MLWLLTAILTGNYACMQHYNFWQTVYIPFGEFPFMKKKDSNTLMASRYVVASGKGVESGGSGVEEVILAVL